MCLWLGSQLDQLASLCSDGFSCRVSFHLMQRCYPAYVAATWGLVAVTRVMRLGGWGRITWILKGWLKPIVKLNHNQFSLLVALFLARQCVGLGFLSNISVNDKMCLWCFESGMWRAGEQCISWALLPVWRVSILMQVSNLHPSCLCNKNV